MFKISRVRREMTENSEKERAHTKTILIIIVKTEIKKRVETKE